MSFFPKLICQFKVISVKIPTVLFLKFNEKIKVERTFLKKKKERTSCTKYQRTLYKTLVI